MGKTMYFSLVLFLEDKLFWLKPSEENSDRGRHQMKHGKI